MRNMKVSELIIDFDLYPRNNVDKTHVRHLVDALEAGAELPPVLVDKKSKRVIDGVHRTRAALRHVGADGEISVIEKPYTNDAEMFLDAMRLNSAHGAKLDSADRVHCAIVAERLSISIEDVAGALQVRVDRFGSLVADRTATCGRLKVALKRTNRHMAGHKLSKQQREANERSSGMNQQFYVNQVIDLIESDLLNKENEKLMEKLSRLHELLGEALARVAA